MNMLEYVSRNVHEAQKNAGVKKWVGALADMKHCREHATHVHQHGGMMGNPVQRPIII